MSSPFIRVLILGNTLTLDLVRRLLNIKQEFCTLQLQLGDLALGIDEVLAGQCFAPDMIVTDCQTRLPDQVDRYLRANPTCQILTVDPLHHAAFLPMGVPSAIPLGSDLADMIRASMAFSAKEDKK